jgi:hypothetical protein
MNLAQFGKAGFAALVAFGGALTTVLVGDVGFGDVSDGQWVASVVTALIAAGGVWGLPYVPSKVATKGK